MLLPTEPDDVFEYRKDVTAFWIVQARSKHVLHFGQQQSLFSGKRDSLLTKQNVQIAVQQEDLNNIGHGTGEARVLGGEKRSDSFIETVSDNHKQCSGLDG